MMWRMTRMVLTLAGLVAMTGCDLLEVDSTPVTNKRGQATPRGQTSQRGQVDFLPGRPTQAPLPQGVPFVGEEGSDEYGRPRKRPDSVALLALLHAKRFEQLDEAMEHYQSQFEADHSREWWPHLAIGSFGIGDESLGPLLDAWVEASPKSFGAHASRAAWSSAMGWAARGGAFASKTPDAQMQQFHTWMDKAIPQFDDAIRLRPNGVAAIKRKLDDQRSAGAPDSDLKKTYEQALEVCPSCSLPRYSWILGQAPRWGGSEAKMREAATVSESELAKNPALGLLPSFIAFDRCRTAQERKDDAAETICRNAASKGPVPRIACRYGDMLTRREAYAQAAPVLEAALRVDPQERTCLVARSWVHKHDDAFEAAANDLLLARRLDPTNDDIQKSLSFILKRLRYDAREAGKRGDDETDKRLRALANDISPGAGDPRANLGLSATNLEALRKEVEAAPRDFKLHIKLDQALAREKRFDEIVKMWDRFLKEQPDHSKALLERAGAKWHGGDQAGGIQDAKQACHLGLKKACNVSRQMQGG